MAILGFKKRFAGKVRNGQKRQTIRAFRKHPIRVGETLYLYTALRTKYAKKLREAVCTYTGVIFIFFNKGEIILPDQIIDKRQGLDAFAKADGFKDFDDLRQFWFDNHAIKRTDKNGRVRKYLPSFKGTLTKW